jgi:hypothetical protein
MRLIDADKLKAEMMKSHEYHGSTSELISALERDIRIVDEQPTAYNMDNVIEELEDTKECLLNSINDCIALSDKEVYALTEGDFDKAIDIVKRGGVNESIY